jgi:hypothetical protein
MEEIETMTPETRQPVLHYCHCGKWGSFGYGVCLRKGQEGVWYCEEHKPQTVSSRVAHRNEITHTRQQTNERN